MHLGRNGRRPGIVIGLLRDGDRQSGRGRDGKQDREQASHQGEASAAYAARRRPRLAVNVTVVVPVTPANVGVFPVSVAAVLTAGFGLSGARALGYGIVLQVVEVVTAVALGMPALLREGLTWSDLRLQALRSVELAPMNDAVSPPRPG